MKNNFVILYSLFLCFGVYSQNLPELSYYNDNYSTLIPKKTYSQVIGQTYNTDLSSQGHPDFGTLPFDAPQKNVVEVISKRTVDERFYIDINEPQFFYIQKSGVPINFYRNNYLVAIDPTLQQQSPGVFSAPNQPYPTSLDFNAAKTVLNCQNYFVENNKYTLSIINSANAVTTYTSNWSNYVVGNNGAYVTDVFPGIDMKLIFDRSKVKCNFILKTPIANRKKIILTDHLNLSNGLSLIQQSGFPGQLFIDDISVVDLNSTQQFLIKKANSYDASGITSNMTFNNYKIIGNDIELHVDSVFLSMPGIVYPVTIDPTFTAVGPIAAPANTIGSDINPAFCSQNLTVVFPGGSTPWDFSSTWQTASGLCCSILGNCTNAFPLVDIISSCGGVTPLGAGFFWQCTPGCNTPGTWGPTIPFNSSGCQGMVQCYPASCSAQNFNFTFHLRRGNACPTTGGCNCTYATNTCVRLNNWSVTLQGRSAETLANTVTGNGTTTQAATCFGSVTMNPGAAYGVGPYTYLWAPGGQTTPTKTFSPTAPGNNVFTCNVTDACGTVRVATFTITNNCVLPIELTDFTASYNGEYASVNWTTATEKNTEYFTIEKSTNGVDYILLQKVAGAVNSTSTKKYSVNDLDPNKKGINYYRLKQFDIGGTEKYSKIITLDIIEESMEVKLIPNPAANDVDIELSNKFIGKTINIELYDITGKKFILKQDIKITSENRTTHLNLSDLPQGSYFINVITDDFTIYKNKLIKF